MSQAEVSKSYKDLKVWQKGIDFVTMIYSLSAGFPAEETYGLKSQIRRAAVSIPSNIAEGQGRGARPVEFSRFLRIALGSLAEVDPQLELARKLEYVTETEIQTIDPFTIELRKMLYGLINSLSTR